ncbi:MAG: M23 family metallopeptidase [Gemmatimonadota bacterium]
MTAPRRRLTVMLIPEGADEYRSFSVSYRTLWALGVGGVVALGLVLALAGSWWYFAARAARVDELEGEVLRLEGEQARIEALAAELDEVERRYNHIRALFGSGSADAAADLWLPPARGTRRSTRSRGADDSALPVSWPLTEPGLVTQRLLDDAGGEHSGIDIAVPTDSYIRAAGSGTVREVGEDEVYGRYVIVDHRDGYSTLYGHASLTLVEAGQPVRKNEVIALSGSTGRSTAPHLHFEVLLNGEALDPLSFVTQP